MSGDETQRARQQREERVSLDAGALIGNEIGGRHDYDRRGYRR